jgi:transcription elongation factor GreA
MNQIPITRNGSELLKAELKQLKSIDRPEVVQAIAEARAQGDLSENAEYDAAKEAQGLLEARIAKLEVDVSNARVLDESDMDISTVHLLTKVTIKNIVNGMEMTYAIVSEAEADLAAKKISVTSPIGKGLLGKAVGDIADIEAPNGIIHFEIIKITMVFIALLMVDKTITFIISLITIMYLIINFFIKLILVIAVAVINPEKSAPPTPALTISCPVKYSPLIGVLGLKNF